MSKIEDALTGAEIVEYAEKDSVMGYFLPCHFNEEHHVPTESQQIVIKQSRQSVQGFYDDSRDDCRAYFYTYLSFTRTQKHGRVAGYVTGENDDGSLRICLIGTGNFNIGGSDCVSSLMSLRAKGNMRLSPENPEMYLRKMLNNSGLNPQFQAGNPFTIPEVYEQYATFQVNGESAMQSLPPELVLSQLYEPVWTGINAGEHNTYTMNFVRYNGQYIENVSGATTLTKNPSTTLEINVPWNNISFNLLNTVAFSVGYNNSGGDVYAMCFNNLSTMTGVLGGLAEIEVPDTLLGSKLFEPPITGTYAGYGRLFNTVLTRDLQSAIKYVDDGILPSDAFLFPFDVDHIPTNDDGANPMPPEEVPKSDTPSEINGDPSDDLTPTPLVTPQATPQSLTNNNLYWLLTLQLKNFIDWFWTDATSIASVGDLWDKIKGLYENLSEAVLNIRYMPIQDSWIGGTSLVNSIIVGMIEKEGQVLALNKSVATVRYLGQFNIEEFYESFCDYSPYTEVSLYLPFHGFIDLDVNMMMGNKIKVYVAYDITSGTIQYFVYRDSELINTCVCKMAVDIPISLQTKSSRDSAIFQNVANATGSLLGATASTIAGNPIGLVMSMQGLSGTQAHGAPMALKGTIGESGAFYAPNRCAIYIKNPKYNKPSKDGVDYASQVGYPCNGVYKLKKGIGYTQVYNPKINFTNSGNAKPLKEEIDEIYEYLEKGVIL